MPISRRNALLIAGATTAGIALGLPRPAAAAAPAGAGGVGAVGLVSRSANLLDAFAAGADGFVYTAAWQPGWTEFHGWWRVSALRVAPCSPISAVSRSLNKMDIFAAGLDGRVYTAAWQPGDTAFRGWWTVGNLVTTPHGWVMAVSRSADKLDVFAVGIDGKIYTAAWQPGDTGFRGWWPVGNLSVPPRATITAVSRSADKMDVFATGTDGRIYTAAWQPGDTAFRGWWSVAGGAAHPGTPINCVSRSKDLLDVLAAGNDAKVYAAAWQPGWTEFHGWWPVSDLLTGMSDPGVGQWTQTGTTFWAENTSYSEEAQGMATDGSAWYLVSNGDKTLRKRVGGSWTASVVIPQGKSGGHVGAPGCYDGWVYVPVQGPHGIWKIKTDLTSPQWFPIDNKGQDILPWSAVNPLNGRLYTSLYPAPTTLLAFDRLTLQRRPEDDIALKPGPNFLDRVQGGVFTPNGRVILVRCDYNAVFCYSALTGHCYGAKTLSGMDEAESVAVRDWVYSNGSPAKVHILDLDNDWASGDDCYLRGYSVPKPLLL